MLAHQKAKAPVCSKLIARSVGANPAVIRRPMTALGEADLVASHAGRHGGFSLARPAMSISLADVYRAVEDATLFKPHTSPPNSACPVGARIAEALARPLAAAEHGLLAALAGSTLGDIAAGMAE